MLYVLINLFADKILEQLNIVYLTSL